MTAEDQVPAIERAAAWSLRQPLTPIALVGLAGISLTYSLSEANWVVANTGYANAIWLGLLCGAALARSRFRGATSLAYTVCLSLLCSGNWVGGILRPLWTPGTDVLWAMSVRLDALLLRLRSWGAAVTNRGTIHDTGFFVFLSVFVIWNVGAWLVWALVRRRRVWEGLLPAAGLLAVNVHLSGQKTLWLSVFIAAGFALAAYASYFDFHTDWDKRQVDYPSEVWLTWGGSAAIIACAITLAAQAAILFGTPTGWHAIGDVWRSTQQQTAELATRLFSDVNPPRINTPPAPAASGGQGGTLPPVEVATAALLPDLQLIGAAPDQSPWIVMWVQTGDPPPLPPEAAGRPGTTPPPQHYWRAGLLATYTGSGWEPLSFPAEIETFGPEVPPAGRYPLFQHFEILARHADNLFAANLPVTVTAGIQVKYSLLGDSAVLKGTLSNYQVLSWVSNATAAQLSSAGTDYPPEIVATYLQLPATLPERVRALADRITAAVVTPYEKALLIQEYLRANLTYTLNVPPPPPGQDAVDYFLFEAPGGFCSYYASAMAVMLRAEGVPARVVTGYAMGTYDFSHAAYGVSGASAHAWVEVYFPAYGWVEFEPTASRSEFVRPAEPPAAPQALTPAPPSLQAASARRVISWGLALAGLGLLLVSVGAVRAYRAREAGWNTPRGRARSLYRQMRNSLAQAGFWAPENFTPDEFMAAYQAPLADYPTLALALAEATRLYLHATFSGQAPDRLETGRVWRLWLRAGRDRLRLWWRAARTRLGQRWPQSLSIARVFGGKIVLRRPSS